MTKAKKTQEIFIPLDPETVSWVRQEASKLGIRPETFIRRIVLDWLKKEKQSAATK